jgi:Tfp pilus assembly protein PilF
MGLRLWGMTACAVLLLLGPVIAASQRDSDDCSYMRGASWMAACTRIIDDLSESPNAHSVAHYVRGMGYAAEGDRDRAMADLDEAIRLDPKFAFPYVSRGNLHVLAGSLDSALADYNRAIELNPKLAVAHQYRGSFYYGKGDFDRAIADLAEAIRLNPRDELAYRNRGKAHLAKGEFDRADADYHYAIRLNPKSASAFRDRGNLRFLTGDFVAAAEDMLRAMEAPQDIDRERWIDAVLWRYLARARAGDDALPELKANVGRLKVRGWLSAIALHLGQLSPDATLAVAVNSDERCIANFHVGQWHLLKRDVAQARNALQNAVDTCTKIQIEHDVAAADLKRLAP